MEQRERDKKSRQILSQQFLCPDTTEELPLFNAPIRVAQSDDRIQAQLGTFEIAMPLMDKYIGVQGPSQMRASSGQPSSAYAHMSVGGVGVGFNSSNREGYSNSRGHMMVNHAVGGGSASQSQSQSSSASLSSAAPQGFLKPKEAPPPNGMSRYNSHGPGHARPMAHDVSVRLAEERN